jgi:hypothetical protein
MAKNEVVFHEIDKQVWEQLRKYLIEMYSSDKYPIGVTSIAAPGHAIQIPRPPRPCTECHAVAVLLAEADSDGRCVYCHTRRSEWRERGAGIKAEVVEEYQDGDCWERPGAES